MPGSAFSLALAVAAALALTAPAATTTPVTTRAATTRATPAAPVAAAGTAPRWTWPVDPPRVLRGFDDVGRYAAGHRGVDLTASAGQDVVAVAPGSVTFAGPVAGRSVVVVLHADGLRTTYEPVVPLVWAGTQVAAGQVLGAVAGGAPHCAVPCLHLGARAGEDYLDPLPRLRADPPVLLPLGRP